MKNFFAEFKKFITRGNVLDMAVGVIVGGAFTAIVNGLSNFILKPIINWILALVLGADTLSELFTFLKAVPALDETGAPLLDEVGKQVMDLTQSIYIDWGSFINAIINFLLVAFVLFVIVRTFNRVKDNQQKLLSSVNEGQPTRAERKEMKKRGIKFSDKAAVAAYYAEKAAAIETEKKAAEEKAAQERLANPTTEDLLKQILAEMQKNA